MKKLFTARRIIGNTYVMYHKIKLSNQVNILVGISFFQMI